MCLTFKPLKILKAFVRSPYSLHVSGVARPTNLILTCLGKCPTLTIKLIGFVFSVLS